MRAHTGMALVVTVVLLPSLADAKCLSLREARKEFPGQYLSWHGDHCWFSPKAERKHGRKHKEVSAVSAVSAKLDPPQKTEKPSNPPPPVQSVTSPEPEVIAPPAAPPAPVLTAEALVQHYIDTTLATRIDVETSEIEQVKAEMPPPPTSKPLSIWESAMVGTLFLIILSGMLLATAVFFGLLRNQFSRKQRELIA